MTRVERRRLTTRASSPSPEESAEEVWHALHLDEVHERLATTDEGLGEKEAIARGLRYGPDRLSAVEVLLFVLAIVPELPLPLSAVQDLERSGAPGPADAVRPDRT